MAALSPMPRAETLADSFACRDMPVSGPFPLAVTDDFWSIWAFAEFDTVLTAMPTPSANEVAALPGTFTWEWANAIPNA